MKRASLLLLLVVLLQGCAGLRSAGQSEGWVSLFNGRNLDGWSASERPGTFSVDDGAIVVHGPRSHLYYTGPVENHDFKNFEFKTDVMTKPGANSGIYFHTAFQQDGWPEKGFEVQVNNSHTDWKRTAGLYDVKDVRDAPAKDNEWFTVRIVVEDRHVRTFVDDKLVVDHTEPAGAQPPSNHPQRVISSGTFAFQGHDPESEVHYRNVMVRPLPD